MYKSSVINRTEIYFTLKNWYLFSVLLYFLTRYFLTRIVDI